jgi:hypothetical protein
VLGSTAVGCDEGSHAFYEANRDDGCKPVNVAGPKVIKFLQLEPAEQLKTLQEIPQLCPIYQGVADQTVREYLQKFGIKDVTHQCVDGQTALQLTYDNDLKMDIKFKGTKARMQTFGRTFDVDYRKNENGRMSVAGIVWRSGYGGTRPIRYQFPADLFNGDCAKQ